MSDDDRHVDAYILDCAIAEQKIKIAALELEGLGISPAHIAGALFDHAYSEYHLCSPSDQQSLDTLLDYCRRRGPLETDRAKDYQHARERLAELLGPYEYTPYDGDGTDPND